MSTEWRLTLLLRLIGGFSLTALIFVFVPYSWMNAIHGWLGLGMLPDQPIVGYLARSLSAFYALVGGLLWFISLDVKRHRPLLLYMGFAFTCFGMILFGIDWVEGLPLFWKLWEGPFVAAIGLALLIMGRAIER